MSFLLCAKFALLASVGFRSLRSLRDFPRLNLRRTECGYVRRSGGENCLVRVQLSMAWWL